MVTINIDLSMQPTHPEKWQNKNITSFLLNIDIDSFQQFFILKLNEYLTGLAVEQHNTDLE